MTPALDRAGRALVALASAACVSAWLWPSDAEPDRLEPPLSVSIVQVTPIVPAEPLPPEPQPPAPPASDEAAPRPASAASSAPPPRAEPPTREIATAQAAAPRILPADRAAAPRVEPGLREGSMPKLRASYVRIGFAAYRDAMLALGGGFFLFDASAKQPLAEIDPLTGAIRGEALRPELSRWPRDVTSHLEAALELGRQRYGARASRVILLPPALLDTTLLAALERDLPPLGVDLDQVVRVDLVYELREGRLACEVVGIGLRDADDRALELRVELSDPIPGLSYRTSREEMEHA